MSNIKPAVEKILAAYAKYAEPVITDETPDGTRVQLLVPFSLGDIRAIKADAVNRVLLIRACRETLMFLSAPPDSPRQWPVARANLHDLLVTALDAAGEE